MGKKVINQKKKNIRLNRLKTFYTSMFINDVYIFPNKKCYLVLGNNAYKICDKSDKCLIAKKNVNYKYIKIIDNNSFMCLKGDTKLININIKDGKLIQLFEFSEKLNNLLYYGNKFITLNLYNRIKIWEESSYLKFNCLTEIVLTKENNARLFIFLVSYKNILIVNNYNEKITYFIELNKFTIIDKVNDLSCKKLYQLNDNLFILPDSNIHPLRSILNIYDFNKKEIIEKKIIHYFSNCEILILPKKKVFLMGEEIARTDKRDFILIGLNFNYEEIFILTNLNNKIFMGSLGFKYFEEKNNIEDIILIYERSGSINFVSLLA